MTLWLAEAENWSRLSKLVSDFIDGSGKPQPESEPQRVMDRLLRECLKRRSLM